MADDVIAATMVDAFEKWGLIRLTGAPTDDREVERFADRLAYVREIAFDRVANIKVSVDPYTLGFTILHCRCTRIVRAIHGPRMSWCFTVSRMKLPVAHPNTWTEQRLSPSCENPTLMRFVF